MSKIVTIKVQDTVTQTETQEVVTVDTSIPEQIENAYVVVNQEMARHVGGRPRTRE